MLQLYKTIINALLLQRAPAERDVVGHFVPKGLKFEKRKLIISTTQNKRRRTYRAGWDLGNLVKSISIW